MADPRPIELSILIVTYNCSVDFARCLESIRKHVNGIVYEVLVRDNASRDADAVERLASEDVRVILGGDNPGFGVANNEIAKLARGEFLLCLNPDTILVEDVPTALVEHLRSHSECGACGPLLENPDGTLQDGWGEPTNLLWDFCEGHYLQGLHRRVAWARRRKSSTMVWSVGFVSGACICVRADLWRNLDGFDPRFFLNHEDVELCDRVRARGLSVDVLASHRIVHAEGTTQRRDWSRYAFHRLQGKWIYLGRRYRGWKLLIARGLWWESVFLKMSVGFVILRGSDRTRLGGFWHAAQWVVAESGAQT